ncbi:MAG: DUF4391 domain-containing protein [Victivallales bacterium]|nr:DUF4391 domain-containing protein [Victivallales bacterium]
MQPFPDSTVFGKAIPKAKFYDKMPVSSSVKRAFVEQVDGIVWKNKLSASTLNVQAGERVTEIDVFEMVLKKQSANDSLLRAIDNGVPHHILFLLQFDGLWQVAIGYKEIGKTAITLTVKEYYRTSWQPLDHIHLLISGVTMDEVFDNFVRQINTSLPEKSSQSLRADLENQTLHDSIKRKIDVLYKRMRIEKQNHKVFALYQEILALKAQLTEK